MGRSVQILCGKLSFTDKNSTEVLLITSKALNPNERKVELLRNLFSSVQLPPPYSQRAIHGEDMPKMLQKRLGAVSRQAGIAALFVQLF